MVPWPIAVLSLYYAVVATAAARMAWLIVTGVTTDRLLLTQLGWLGLAAGAAVGLALLRPWGRTLAIWTSLLLMVMFAGLAAVLVLTAHKVSFGLMLACLGGLQYIPVRYLRRPAVKACFEAQP